MKLPGISSFGAPNLGSPLEDPTLVPHGTTLGPHGTTLGPQGTTSLGSPKATNDTHLAVTNTLPPMHDPSLPVTTTSDHITTRPQVTAVPTVVNSPNIPLVTIANMNGANPPPPQLICVGGPPKGHVLQNALKGKGVLVNGTGASSKPHITPLFATYVKEGGANCSPKNFDFSTLTLPAIHHRATKKSTVSKKIKNN